MRRMARIKERTGGIGSSAVLVFIENRGSRRLLKNVRSVLSRLGLGCVQANWKTGASWLEVETTDIPFVIVDPSVEDFSSDRTVERLQALMRIRQSQVILLRNETSRDLPDIQDLYWEERLNASASIGKSDCVVDLGFVFQRLLFPQSQNKRSTPRALATLDIEWSLNDHLDKHAGKTFCVGKNGMFVQNSLPVPEKSKLRITIHSPDRSTPIHCTGTIVYVQHANEDVFAPKGMGIRFESIQPDDRSWLEEYVYDRILRIDRQAKSLEVDQVKFHA